MTRPIDNPVLFASKVLGVEPHPKQSAYLRSTHRTRLAAGGRRSGKTTVIAIELAYWAVRAVVEDRPFKQLCIAPGIDQAKLLINAVSRLIRNSPVGGLLEHEVQTPFPELMFARSDVVIMVRGAHEGGKTLRGHSADRCVVDEAAFVDENVITEVIYPTLADTGGSLVLASTPRGRGGLFHTLWDRGQAGHPEIASFHFRSAENPHIDRAFIEAQREALTAQQWRVEYGGEFLDDSDLVFAWNLISEAAVAAPEGPRSGRRYVLGWDPAKRQDGSILTVLDVTDKVRRLVHLENLKGASYTAQVDRVAALAGTYQAARVVVDAYGPGIACR